MTGQYFFSQGYLFPMTQTFFPGLSFPHNRVLFLMTGQYFFSQGYLFPMTQTFFPGLSFPQGSAFSPRAVLFFPITGPSTFASR